MFLLMKIITTILNPLITSQGEMNPTFLGSLLVGKELSNLLCVYLHVHMHTHTHTHTFTVVTT